MIEIKVSVFGKLFRVEKPGDYNHGRLGRLTVPIRHAKQIPDGHFWIELKSSDDGSPYYAHYHRDELIPIDEVKR